MNLTTGGKVRALLVAALTFTAVVGVAGFLAQASLARLTEDYGTAKVPSFQSLTGLATAVAKAASEASAVENQSMDAAGHAAALKQLEESVGDAVDEAKTFEGIVKPPEVAKAWARTSEALSAWSGNLVAFRQAAQERDALADRFAEAAAKQSVVTARFGQMRKLSDTLLGAVEDASLATRKAADSLREEATATERSARVWIIGAFLLSVAVLGGWGLLLARQTARTTSALLAETGRLEAAVAAGTLDVRADEGLVDAEFRPIVAGINQTMDAFVRPIRVTAEHVSRIGKGDIPAKITDAYQGDFNLIKSSLNDCIDAVNALVADAGLLARAGVEGRLATRADATRHQGDFRKVVQGVNETLDAVIGPLNVAGRYVDQISKGQIPGKITDAYQGDFNTIKDNLNRCIDAVNALVEDAGQLAQAGVEGRLATRADASRHQGDFRRVVEGVNQTLDAVINPLNVAARYVDQISKGQIDRKSVV
jgi:hypothetical protein